ncbi:MAG TPA: GDP-mannose 4,6-dehydratase [Candidatus Nanoarchaeia archaeon]|nr:GDP-mannose 4,6-dehydratase [Candidatus Nanoarchaeia archaeon]
MKTALITGITGQDGPYLAKLLLEKGYKVYGTYRRTSSPNFWRLQHLGILDKVTLIPADLCDMASLLEAVTVSNPDEIYNLAAQSFVGASFDQPLLTTEIDASGSTRFLEIIRHLNKNIKYYQASTSELYGGSKECPQDERTPMIPNSPYAAAKLHSFHMNRIYRHSYGLFASNGILFNHESPLRGMEFVTRKITNSAAKIKLGLQKDLKLGNLEAKRDWGYAPEFVKAMWRMMQHHTPDDFVVATGETHSVKEFAEEAFAAVGLDWKDHVISEKNLHRPMEVHQLCGDPSKAKEILGWEPKVTFHQLVKIMAESDLRLWKLHLNGKSFPWDAPSFPQGMDLIARNVTRDASRSMAAVNSKLLKKKSGLGKIFG